METFDAYGSELASGDSVQLVKDLKVRGTKITLKKGTLIKKIKLTSNPEEVDCSSSQIKKLVLRTEYVKKK